MNERQEAAWLAPSSNDNPQWMPTCYLDCSLCGALVYEAVHICCEAKREVTCVNFCRSCLDRINAAVAR